MISLDHVRQILRYDPETGVLSRADNGEPLGWLDKSNGYVRLYVDRQKHYAHNVIWFMMTGTYPSRKGVDHADTDRANNRWANLRRADPKLQQANRRMQANNKLGVKGVSYCNLTGRYRASITVDGQSLNLGRRDTIEEAAALYAAAARRYYGEFARTA